MRIVGDRRGRSTGGGRARALESLAMAMGESVFLLTVGGRSLPPAAGALSSLALQNSPPSDARTSEIGLNLGRF
jgi:hypothetical protein